MGEGWTAQRVDSSVSVEPQGGSDVLSVTATADDPALAAQLGQSGDELKKMQKEVQGTKFDVKGSKITGSTATLKVQRSKGDEVETAEVRMGLENGEWKMTP